MQISSLLSTADQFLQERNWWQFHTPKNESINLLVEACELLEPFSTNDQITAQTRAGVADEMADVLFGTLMFAVYNSIDIAASIAHATHTGPLTDATVTYETLCGVITQHKNIFGVENIHSARHAVISLIMQIRELTDIFIWCTNEESKEIAQQKKVFIGGRIAFIFAHLVHLQELTHINAATEFVRKMKQNAEKYPVEHSSAADYAKIKDARKNR